MDNVLLCIIAELCEIDEYYEKRNMLKSLRDHSDPFSTTDKIFEKNYRFSKNLCYQLIEQLKPQDTEVEHSTIAFEFRFLAALYFYSHGSYQKCVGNNYNCNMSPSLVSLSIQSVSQLICSVKQEEVSFPQTLEEKKEMKNGFYDTFGIKATIGAVSCTHIGLVEPNKSDVLNPVSLYMNRKGFYSINVEAICDYRLQFTSMNASFPGSCHNSAIWTTSQARQHLMANHSESSPTWLLGNEEYPLEPWLMTPLSEPSSEKEKNYNKMHFKAREVVERALCVLKARFRCLSKHHTLHYDHINASNIIGACFILHNILMKYNVPIDVDLFESDEEEESQYVPVEMNSSSEAVLIRRRYIDSL